METRYQVFVSSTYEDLKEERNEVIKALLSLIVFLVAWSISQPQVKTSGATFSLS